MLNVGNLGLTSVITSQILIYFNIK